MATFLVGAVVFAVLGLAAYSTYRSRKKGGCGCGCEGCEKTKSGDCCH